MSEVSDACQIVMITGKGAYYFGKISTAAAMMVLKTINTIYLAKWHGVTSLRRFRRIQGDDWTYINISSEDPAVLRSVYKEMTDHGLLLAELPDLCGGDGRTQCVISPKDAEKFKAFLLDHNNGKYKDIKVGPISAEDYAHTGYDSQGKETPEMADLSASARENIKGQRQIGARAPAGFLAVGEGGENWSWGNYTYSNANSESRAVGFGQNNENRQASDTLAIKYYFARHDEQVNENYAVKWINDPPFKEHEKWAMYIMPDGTHAIIVPDQDRYQMQSPEGGIMYRAAVRPNNFYNVVNLANGDMQLKNGAEVMSELDRPSVAKENEDLKNMVANLGLPDLSVYSSINSNRSNVISFTPPIGSDRENTYDQRGIADDLYTTIRLNSFAAFSAGLVNGPYSMVIPDSSEKEGFRQITFYRSDCSQLADGQNTEIHILSDESGRSKDETLVVNNKMLDSVVFAPTDGKNGIAVTIPGETRDDPVMALLLMKPYDYDKTADGKVLEVHIDPEKNYEVNLVGRNGFNRVEEIKGSDIISQYNIAESRIGVENPNRNMPREESRTAAAEIMPSSYGKGIADDLYDTIKLNPGEAFSAGLINGPYSMMIPDSSEREGFRQVTFYKSDCTMLPDGQSMDVHIPAERSFNHQEETFRVNKDLTSSFVTFGSDETEKGVSISIPGETPAEPVMTMSLHKPYDYDRASSGQKLEIHIDPEKDYEVSFVGPGNFTQCQEVSGKDILSRYKAAETRTAKNNPVESTVSHITNNAPVRNSRSEGAVPSGR